MKVPNLGQRPDFFVFFNVHNMQFGCSVPNYQKHFSAISHVSLNVSNMYQTTMVVLAMETAHAYSACSSSQPACTDPHPATSTGRRQERQRQLQQLDATKSALSAAQVEVQRRFAPGIAPGMGAVEAVGSGSFGSEGFWSSTRLGRVVYAWNPEVGVVWVGLPLNPIPVGY